MKKIFGLFAILLFLTGCDDGDMSFKSFNFTSTTAQSCSNSGLIYKVQGSEALLLQLAPGTLINAENIQDGVNVPREIGLSGSNTLVYRTYTGPVTSTNICSSVPQSSPSLVEEYNAQAGGTLSVLTEKVFNIAGVLTGYNHIITIVNATFTREGESIIVTNNVFGSFISPVTYRFDFLDDDDTVALQNCGGGLISQGNAFTVNGDEALYFDIDPTSFPSTAGTTTIDLANTSDAQQVIFSEYSGTVVATLFCDAVPPITPVVTKQWEAIGGTLRIVTSIVGSSYVHVFYFDNVTFMNRAINAEQFTINAEGGYRVGKLTIPIG